MTLPAILIRVGLPVVLMCGLSGCLGLFVVGYPNGTEKEEPKSLAIRLATATNGPQELLVQEITHTARLLASPDGGRDKEPIGSEFHYFLREGDAPPRELAFLRTAYSVYTNLETDAEQEFKEAFPIGNTNEWLGIRCPIYRVDDPDDYDRGVVTSSNSSHQFTTGRYPVVIFSPDKILQRYEIETVVGAPQFQMLPGGKLIRFWRNDGWCLLDIASGQVHPEPNRPDESAPTNKSIIIPGTGWKIVMDAPVFEESYEEFSILDYSYTGNTRKDRPGPPPLEDMKVPDKDGLRFTATIQNDPAPNVTRTGQFQRIERIIPGIALSNSDGGGTTPETKTIRYQAYYQGRFIEIELMIYPPYERWNETIAHFDAALRFENAVP